MRIGKARAIWEDIESDQWDRETKAIAIYQVLSMETHNSVTKKSCLKVIAWLWNQIFEWRTVS